MKTYTEERTTGNITLYKCNDGSYVLKKSVWEIVLSSMQGESLLMMDYNSFEEHCNDSFI